MHFILWCRIKPKTVNDYGIVFYSDPVCTLPTDLDPDIIVNPLKDEYILDDFILLYCPPIPYATRGTAFSLCIDGRWDPSISDNACYGNNSPSNPFSALFCNTYLISFFKESLETYVAFVTSYICLLVLSSVNNISNSKTTKMSWQIYLHFIVAFVYILFIRFF